MKVVELLQVRREKWNALDAMCGLLERKGGRRMQPELLTRFAALYRAACADLALADAYQLPPETVDYLHQLVGRAHNQLYRSKTFNFRAWGREMLSALPQRLARDRVLWLAFVLFWGVFITSAFLSFVSPAYRGQALDAASIARLEESFSGPIFGRPADDSTTMVGFYIMHNTGIGLQCFAAGLLLGVGGLFATIFNAMYFGAVFGYMAAIPQRTNFFHFVTAHGPCELTAIVLAAAAGMRLGFSLVDTGGLTRSASLRRAGVQAMPTMGASMFLFAMAALLEAFLSPSAAPYWIKALAAITTGGMLLFYFFGLGVMAVRRAGAEG